MIQTKNRNWKQYLQDYIPFVTLTYILVLFITSVNGWSYPYLSWKPSVIGALGFHFLHAGPYHFISNAVAILIFGSFIEINEGKGKYFRFLIIAHLVISAITYVFGWLIYNGVVAGASGVAFAMIGYVLGFSIYQMYRKFLSWKTIFMLFYAFISLLLVGSEIYSFILKIFYDVNDHIAREIHLYGFVTGFMSWLFMKHPVSSVPNRQTETS